MLTSLPPVQTLNENELSDVVKLLFESAPPLIKRLQESGPYPSYQALIDKAETLLLQSLDDPTIFTPTELLDILNAHPRIGDTNLSHFSKLEQSKSFTTAVHERLTQLNHDYEAKYGFRFIIFVNGRSKEELIPEFEQRLLHSDQRTEMQTAFQAMIAIARDRLAKLQS
jgi:2-oxo-4-hydroxy-4-carboxy--5-ureidoimidazoline (OHCU) decarboxylase